MWIFPDEFGVTHMYIPNIQVWAKGFDQDALVFSMIKVTGSTPQYRNLKNFRKGRLQIVQAQAP